MPMTPRRMAPFLVILAGTALSGCVAQTALDVVTAPVKIAGKAVDLATTSQSEADEKRGRELRKREEQLGKLERRYADQIDDCRGGDEDACEKARNTYDEMQAIIPTIPAEPEPRN